jgi:archaellum component FlaG (FlaF/FlaG flagellin family)
MSKSNTFETDLLGLIFNNTDITLIGDAAGLQNSATAGSLYVSLHTADPGEAGDQITNETAYTNYARVAVARTGGGVAVDS